jgi:hypothetical protein
MFQQDFLFVEYSQISHSRYPASYERHFSGVPEIHIHEHERGAHESIEKGKEKKTLAFGVFSLFCLVWFDLICMHGGRLGVHLFLGAWSIKFSSHLVERICGTPVPS